MKLQGSVDLSGIDASNFWKILSNVEEVSKCFPGLKSVQKVGENSYRVVGQISVGLIKGEYTADVNFTTIDEVNKVLAFNARGRGMNSIVDLVATLRMNENLLNYDVDVKTSGILASLASRALGTVVDRIVNDLLQCVKTKIQS